MDFSLMAWRRIWSILSILALSSFRLTQQQPSSRKSPPRADVASIQEKLHLGQNLKLTCPIQGDPTPLFEWFKDGEKIDHTWLDYVTRSNNKVLKIRAAKLDDTGLFVCRGVNGFGKAQVNIHLIVVDPQADPQENNFKAPKFTTETQVAGNRKYFRKIGETFSVTCEALGNPIPEIVWLKNGHKLSSGANYIHAGKSSMDLVVLDSSDAGLYSCMARNAIGSVTQNYSLEANGGLNPSSAGSHGPLVVVTGISPVNSTLLGGQSGKLTCTVRSQDTPHIKWLKQVSQDATFTSEANILNVRDNRYQILPTVKDIKVNKDAYVNILSLDDVTEEDNGTYICFVAKNGLNSLTFKSATVFVMPGNQISVDVETKNNIRKNGQIILEKSEVTSLGEGQISMTMMLVIICLSVMSVLMLIILATWYIRYMRHGPKTNSSSAGTGTSESSLPESPDEHHFTHLKTSTYERPNFVYAGQLWPSQNHHIHPTQQQYPLLQHHQLWPGSQPQHLQKVTFRSASHHEMLDDRGDLNRGPQCDNTYEVPFGHLMPRQQKQYSFDGQLGSMSSMQDHFNSAVVPPTTPFLTQQIQRSCSMMQRPPLQPLQFYTHNNDS